MKKLIGIFAILFTITTVFGQTKGAELGELIPEKFFKYSLKSHFTVDGKQYALAHDSTWLDRTYLSGDNDEIKKSVYLWRKDGSKWSIASMNPIKIDYWKKVDGVESYDYWSDNDSTSIERGCDLNELLQDIGGVGGYSSVYIRPNGIIKIRLLNFYGTVGVDDEYQYRWDIITLLPQGDDMYFAVRKL